MDESSLADHQFIPIESGLCKGSSVGGHLVGALADFVKFEFGLFFQKHSDLLRFILRDARDLQRQTVLTLLVNQGIAVAFGKQPLLDDGFGLVNLLLGDGHRSAFGAFLGLDLQAERGSAHDVDAALEFFLRGNDGNEAERGQANQQDGADVAFATLDFSGEIPEEEHQQGEADKKDHDLIFEKGGDG